MPPRNTRVKTASGEGRVVDYQILSQLVVVENNDGTRTVLPRDEIEIISPLQQNTARDDSEAPTDAEDAGSNEQTNAKPPPEAPAEEK
jgi:hypothetical protein